MANIGRPACRRQAGTEAGRRFWHGWRWRSRGTVARGRIESDCQGLCESGMGGAHSREAAAEAVAEAVAVVVAVSEEMAVAEMVTEEMAVALAGGGGGVGRDGVGGGRWR